MCLSGPFFLFGLELKIVLGILFIVLTLNFTRFADPLDKGVASIEATEAIASVKLFKKILKK